MTSFLTRARLTHVVGRTLLLACCLGLASQAQAQAELVVQGGVGTLNDAIENDVNRPANRVYVLNRGQYYGITRELNNAGPNGSFVLRIRAATGSGDRPVIYPGIDATGQGPGGRFIRLVADAHFDGVYFLSVDPNQGQSGIIGTLNTQGQRLFLTNCVLEQGRARFWEINAEDTKIYVRDTQFRNFVRLDATSNGRPFDYRGVRADTLYIENSSFLNIHGFVVHSLGPSFNHVFFQHNTFHTTNYLLANAIMSTQSKDLIFANNLFVNADAAALPGGQRPPPEGGQVAGFLRVDSLDASVSVPFGESDRTVRFVHNNWHTSQEVLDFYAQRTAIGDPLVPRQLIHPPAMAYILANPHAVAEANIATPVTFANPPSMQGWRTWYGALRDGAANPPFYSFGATPDLFPAEQPLPENLSYSTSDASYTAGTSGFPIGDLNWFPARKADWIAAGGGRGVIVNSESAPSAGSSFVLRGSFPNPARGTATISFDLAAPAQVSVDVFDVLGRRVLALPAAQRASGTHQQIQLDTSPLSAGVYLCTVSVQSGSEIAVQTRTMTVVR